MDVVSFREHHRVQEHPHVAQEQADADIEQPQLRIACASANPRLAPLPITRLDAETLAILLPQITRGASHSPRRIDQLLLATFLRSVVQIRLVRDTDREGNLLRLRLHRVPIPADTLLAKYPQAFGSSARLWL